MDHLEPRPGVQHPPLHAPARALAPRVLQPRRRLGELDFALRARTRDELVELRHAHPLQLLQHLLLLLRLGEPRLHRRRALLAAPLELQPHLEPLDLLLQLLAPRLLRVPRLHELARHRRRRASASRDACSRAAGRAAGSGGGGGGGSRRLTGGEHQLDVFRLVLITMTVARPMLWCAPAALDPPAHRCRRGEPPPGWRRVSLSGSGQPQHAAHRAAHRSSPRQPDFGGAGPSRSSVGKIHLTALRIVHTARLQLFEVGSRACPRRW